MSNYLNNRADQDMQANLPTDDAKANALSSYIEVAYSWGYNPTANEVDEFASLKRWYERETGVKL